jgi:hypothetical protein
MNHHKPAAAAKKIGVIMKEKLLPKCGMSASAVVNAPAVPDIS